MSCLSHACVQNSSGVYFHSESDRNPTPLAIELQGGTTITPIKRQGPMCSMEWEAKSHKSSFPTDTRKSMQAFASRNIGLGTLYGQLAI
jgi:hypothetical protein